MKSDEEITKLSILHDYYLSLRAKKEELINAHDKSVYNGKLRRALEGAVNTIPLMWIKRANLKVAINCASAMLDMVLSEPGTEVATRRLRKEYYVKVKETRAKFPYTTQCYKRQKEAFGVGLPMRLNLRLDNDLCREVISHRINGCVFLGPESVANKKAVSIGELIDFHFAQVSQLTQLFNSCDQSYQRMEGMLNTYASCVTELLNLSADVKWAQDMMHGPVDANLSHQPLVSINYPVL